MKVTATKIVCGLIIVGAIPALICHNIGWLRHIMAMPIQQMQQQESTNGVKEIGWRPIIKGVEEETVSGVTYITVSINGDTNDVASYRSCFINLHSGGCLPDDKIFWRLNPKARAQEAYIVSKDMNMTSRPIFFVMRNAKITRYYR